MELIKDFIIKKNLTDCNINIIFIETGSFIKMIK